MIKIVADKDIPFLKGVFEPYSLIEYYNGKEINSDIIKNADILLIRTRTKCNASLLEGSKVKLIATATIGTDHIDLDFCNSHGIKVINAPGCNSGGVMQYVFTAIFNIAVSHSVWHNEVPTNAAPANAVFTNASPANAVFTNVAPANDDQPTANESNAANLFQPINKTKIGVIGVGHVGSKVANLAEYLGFEVLRNDPPKEIEQTLAFNNGYLTLDDFVDYYSIEYILENADIITLHVPLNDSTFKMASDSFFSKIKKGAIFINSSRGEVVDESALLRYMDNFYTVIDVWNNEPNTNLEILKRATIATPHIAGYSLEGKINGTQMAVRGIADNFSELEALKNFVVTEVSPNPNILNLKQLSLNEIASTLLKIFPILDLDKKLRENSSSFEQIRNNYNYRREFYVK
jgi:Phosphoglycerate dehydrogenase and related dehydrogenases